MSALPLPPTQARAGAQEQCSVEDMMASLSESSSAAPLAACDTAFSVELGPLVDTSFSDSANLDSIFELYSKAGRDASEALMVGPTTSAGGAEQRWRRRAAELG